MESSESLTRARQQHDSIVNSMQQKFEKENLLLKENVDELNRQIDDRVRLISLVQKSNIAEIMKRTPQVSVHRILL